MNNTAISKSYWRTIKQELKNFDEIIGNDVKDQVKKLAAMEVVNNTLSAESYQKLIGEPYVASAKED